MQILLLVTILILSIVLFRMLSKDNHLYSYSYITTTIFTPDDKEYETTEKEKGYLALEDGFVIVEGEKFSPPHATVIKEKEKIISISIATKKWVKCFHIDA